MSSTKTASAIEELGLPERLAAAVPETMLKGIAERSAAHRRGDLVERVLPESVVSLLGGLHPKVTIGSLLHAVSGTFCGAIINAPIETPIVVAAGTWTIPTLAAPPRATDGRYSAAQWIGLDGFAQTAGGLLVPLFPLFQVGVMSQIEVVGGQVQEQTNWTFMEWIKQGQTQASPPLGLAVSTGDTVDVVLVKENALGTEGGYWMYNENSGESTTALVPQPAGAASIRGDVACWIVERPIDAGNDSVLFNPAALGAAVPLADFGTVDFGNCGVLVRNQGLDTPATPVDFGSSFAGLGSVLCDMGQPFLVAHAQFINDHTVACTYG